MLPARADRASGALDAALLAVLKLALGAWVLRQGFTHVSDDDYARVVIAELFAHAPKLDPSGTSWLPLPFWTLGGAMMLFGRSLETARGVALALGCAGVVALYLALLGAGVARKPAFVGVALGMATPWNAWLGVATVPEGFTGSLGAVGAVLASVPGARPWGAAALLGASLSRYEAWPICAVFALACAVAALANGTAGSSRDSKGRLGLAAAIAVFGPLAWMAWNAHAHDGALHFLRRVAAFRAANGGEAAYGLSSLPQALAEGAPEIIILGAVGALGAAEQAFRSRWRWPLVALVVQMAFLVVGDARGGGPTHHPARALGGAYAILAACGADGVWIAGRRWAYGRSAREAWLAAFSVVAGLTWAFTAKERLGAFPGASAAENRGAQIAQGKALAASGVSSFDVTPCAFEHFAVLAAHGAPENARILPPDPGGLACPSIVIR